MRHQPFAERHAFRGFQVERDALFVGVEQKKIR
jgi:hypothetical protein